MSARRFGPTAALFASIHLGAVAGAHAAPLGKRQCIAAHEAGQDLRRSGRVREAVEKFEVCTARACPGMVRSDCARRLGEARRAVPTIVFVAKDARGNLVRDARVTMDGAPIASDLDGSPIQVDAGEHIFELVADGFVPVSRRLVIAEGINRHEPIAFEDPRPATKPTTPGGTETEKTVATTHGERGSEDGGDSTGSVLRTGGLVTAGIGVASVAVGITFGLIAKGTYDDALEQRCRGGDRFACDETGVEMWDRAEDQKVVSTVTLISGLALVAVGAVVFFLAPRPGGASSTRVGTRLEMQWAW